MRRKITILGSGTSTGIPMLGCHCLTCTSQDPKDKRLRTSLLLELNNQVVLVDTTPDLRQQLLSASCERIDNVIITHEHADHIFGMDELRPLCFGPPSKSIPLFTHNKCAQHLENIFPYIFQRDKIFTKDKPIIGGGIPLIDLNHLNVSLDQPIRQRIGSEDFTFFLLEHGHTNSLGFHSNEFAYIPDCFEIPPNILNLLEEAKLKVLIINCLQKNEHQTQLTTTKAFDYIRKIKAEQSLLIHMNHELSHQMLSQMILEEGLINTFVSYDRQKIFF